MSTIVPIGAAEQLNALHPTDLVPEAAPAAGRTDPTGGFGTMVAEGLREVNQQLMVSQAGLQQVALGDTQNLHHVMIQLEESRLSFQLMMQVRNRLLEAYQDVMKMQI